MRAAALRAPQVAARPSTSARAVRRGAAVTVYGTRLLLERKTKSPLARSARGALGAKPDGLRSQGCGKERGRPRDCGHAGPAWPGLPGPAEPHTHLPEGVGGGVRWREETGFLGAARRSAAAAAAAAGLVSSLTLSARAALCVSTPAPLRRSPWPAPRPLTAGQARRAHSPCSARLYLNWGVQGGGPGGRAWEVSLPLASLFPALPIPQPSETRRRSHPHLSQRLFSLVAARRLASSPSHPHLTIPSLPLSLPPPVLPLSSPQPTAPSAWAATGSPTAHAHRWPSWWAS